MLARYVILPGATRDGITTLSDRPGPSQLTDGSHALRISLDNARSRSTLDDVTLARRIVAIAIGVDVEHIALLSLTV